MQIVFNKNPDFVMARLLRWYNVKKSHDFSIYQELILFYSVWSKSDLFFLIIIKMTFRKDNQLSVE